MATLVGHSLGAMVVFSAVQRCSPRLFPQGRKRWLIPIFMGVVPDFDVVLIILFPTLFQHRGFTHSALFALALALAVSLSISKFDVRMTAARTGLLFLTALAHPLLDYLMGCGPPVPLLWPLVHNGWLCPVQLIPTAYYSRSARGLLRIFFSPRNLGNFFLEGLSLAPLIFLSARPSCFKSLKPWAATLLLLIMSISGFLSTYALYNLPQVRQALQSLF